MNNSIKKQFNFTTLFFPGISNVHFFKEVVKIPYFLNKYSFNATLVTFKRESKFSNLNKESKGLDIVFLGKSKIEPSFPISKIVKAIYYLFINSKNIDVLNLYHIRYTTLILGVIYKILKKKGILYIKLDQDLRENSSTFLPILKTFLIKIFLKKNVDFATIETTTAFRHLIKLYPFLKNKLEIMPNGIDFVETDLENHIEQINESKKNIILTSGRLGMTQKNNEMLLEAISKIDLKNWKVIFLGNIDNNEFNNYIKEFYIRHPHLKSSIEFKGLIQDKEELISIYKSSSIFCLTSRWESFGLVLIEAMYFGNKIITTNIESANDITNNGKFGTIIQNENTAELISELESYIINFRHKFLNSKAQIDQVKYVSDNYFCDKIVLKLNGKLLKYCE